ncbi:type IV toxin-antitoxin system AbiEi family antitoxin domain-containing protein [Flexistipes sinusarabici]|uniref:Uncharacterized protein n=1 Tax=Flexistipes sinusarabici TaxID=2352 RepID=A0A3D5QFC4_FLESI|nr:type IV toxin-antitoxin system AbiEi family antitoxin domain-containing protein [Flexistipes sinusarabici]HCW93862.1 hypothetical protein [Flexistipes sinusarabici]
MSIKNIEAELIKHFENEASFTTQDIYKFFSDQNKHIKKTSIRWYVYNLVREGKLQRIGRGVYSINNKKEYMPDVNKYMIKISENIKGNFPLISYCVWEIGWLNEFQQHISASNVIILEVEKEGTEAIYYKIREMKKNTFIKPTQMIVENYVLESESPIIITPMVSESPLLKIDDVPVPTLEKMLVDIAAEKEIFYFLQGYELNNVYQNASEKYTININKLMRYAARRNKKTEVNYLLHQSNKNKEITNK